MCDYSWMIHIVIRMCHKWHLIIISCCGSSKCCRNAWWRHQMETFPRYWPFVWGIHRTPVNYPHKGQWRGALMLSLICAWINDWVNNREAGDWRRHRAHYGVTVMVGLCLALSPAFNTLRADENFTARKLRKRWFVIMLGTPCSMNIPAAFGYRVVFVPIHSSPVRSLL